MRPFLRSVYSPNAVLRRVFGRRQKTPIRAGLYARVSTQDQTTLPLQRRAMRDYVGRAVVVEIKEVGSGASVRELRQKLLDAARRRDTDVVIVWRLDRWGRSMADLVTTLQELRDLGVSWTSNPAPSWTSPLAVSLFQRGIDII